MRVLVTGGLGFIGSAVIRHLLVDSDHEVINLDKVTYASTFESVAMVADSPRYKFVRCDLADAAAVNQVVGDEQPQAILHLAAESHVDRSIDGPEAFISSNIVGTFNLLQAARELKDLHRFVHVSTDEVFGSLPLGDGYFDEETSYDPSSPYSASKAASDHLARAWASTYDLPVNITNCSNNYGPFQFPEKMIPVMIIKGFQRDPLPVYGKGQNVRDWLHVEDHARALVEVLESGAERRSYAIGGDSERSNLDLVRQICSILDSYSDDGYNHEDLISFVEDRPGHDLRYAIDATRIRTELGWKPTKSLESGLESTVAWYRENKQWWEPIMDRFGVGERLGLSVDGVAEPK